MPSRKALFVAYANHLSTGGGGVQQCTHEFIRVLKGAGLGLELLPVEQDRRCATRLLRRFNPSQYWRPISRACVDRIQDAASGVEFVFLNQVALAGAIDDLDLGAETPPIVLLSHGCEITDLLHLARLSRTLPVSSRRLWPSMRLALGRTLADEIRARTKINGVISISPFDADTETWLGTSSVTWIPRIIDPHPLRRAAVQRRFGFVGTLDHTPNLEGLVAVLDVLCKWPAHELTVRVVGGPHRLGTWLAHTYPNVEYLGPLDDPALEVEAATWTAFLHPIFCLARGCSTKLATALSWQIPVITTTLGRRGYVWREGTLIEVNNPQGFVNAMYRFDEEKFALESRDNIRSVSQSCERAEDIIAKINTFLNSIKGHN
jgi:glycosyltransferase involved in cell wall biosynthesis